MILENATGSSDLNSLSNLTNLKKIIMLKYTFKGNISSLHNLTNLNTINILSTISSFTGDLSSLSNLTNILFISISTFLNGSCSDISNVLQNLTPATCSLTVDYNKCVNYTSNCHFNKA